MSSRIVKLIWSYSYANLCYRNINIIIINIIINIKLNL